MNETRKTVLVVDDAPANIDVVKSVLSDGYLVQAAVNGKVALNIAEKKHSDLILLDIVMPDMDGYEVCKALKANPATADIPVVFVTGKNEEGDQAAGLEMGAVGYLAKPVDAEELKDKVIELLG